MATHLSIAMPLHGERSFVAESIRRAAVRCGRAGSKRPEGQAPQRVELAKWGMRFDETASFGR